MDAVPTVRFGVLGVFPSDPEVIGVFPEMSSTILPHGQEIRFYRGDDLDIAVQLQNDGDPPDPVSVENSVIRWAAKQGHGNTPTPLQHRVPLGNEAALLVKRSYSASEVEIVDAMRGRVLVHLRGDDTLDLPSVPAVWDLEVTRPKSDVTLPDGARIQVTDGSDVAIAVGFDWTALALTRSDMVEANGRRVLVRQVISPMHVRLDWSNWEPGFHPVVVRRGRTKTVAFGRFVVLGDVVR